VVAYEVRGRLFSSTRHERGWMFLSFGRARNVTFFNGALKKWRPKPFPRIRVR